MIDFRAAEFHRETTDGTQGGVVDITTGLLTVIVPQSALIFTSLGNNTVSYTIRGRNVDGLEITETIDISGTLPVSSITIFSKIISITKTSSTPLLSNVIITGNNTVIGTFTIADSSSAEVTKLLSLGSLFFSTPSQSMVFYEKFFVVNQSTSGSLTFTKLLDSDGVTFAVASGTSTSASRTTKPSDVPLVDFTAEPKTVAVSPGGKVGIWLRIEIPAGSPVLTNRCLLKVEFGTDSVIAAIISPDSSNGFIADVLAHRNLERIGGGNPINYIELVGGRPVEQLFYEPDPVTYRSQFYYNSRINKLFKKIGSSPLPVWKQVR